MWGQRRPFPFFFFSSRRRHTRWNCDWSSDVCSSDLAICRGAECRTSGRTATRAGTGRRNRRTCRSEEHTSELQSQFHLVCRLLLEKKKKKKKNKYKYIIKNSNICKTRQSC